MLCLACLMIVAGLAGMTALLTEVVLAVGQRFGVSFDELHNDSTSISFCGRYRAASGRTIRGRSAPAIVYGYAKDHRPDLKQLLFILTVNTDGHIPVAFRCTDGNVSDSRTHIETWNALRIPRNLDSDSTGNWTRIPRQTGQSERSDAGLKGFTLSLALRSSFWPARGYGNGFFGADLGRGAELSTDARQTALLL